MINTANEGCHQFLQYLFRTPERPVGADGHQPQDMAHLVQGHHSVVRRLGTVGAIRQPAQAGKGLHVVLDGGFLEGQTHQCPVHGTGVAGVSMVHSRFKPCWISGARRR